MDVKDASEIIDSIAESIKTHPNQFHIEVNVTGQSISSYGGTGAVISATGGAPGSTTIGQSVSMNCAQIRIAQKAGVTAMNQQLQSLVDALNQISSELKAKQPDKSKIARIYESLKGTWIPQLIIAVLGNILVKSVGA
jgi:hypothetical protein